MGMLLEYVPPGKAAYEVNPMIRKTAIVFACALLLASVLHAQSPRSAIRGRVEDRSGAAMAGAGITAVNEATSETRTTATGDAGTFAIAELDPGPWRIEITAPGHKTQVQRLTLEVNQERRADARLEIGALTDRVEVTAPLVDLRRGSPAMGTTP